MSVSADRASGLFFFLAGTATYLFVIPRYVETVESGSIYPNTFPNALSIMIAVCGLILAIKPTNFRLHRVRDFAMSAIFMAILCVSVFAMTFVGYVVVSPVLALVLMFLIGERRPAWLLAGVIVMPAMIWFLVEVVLERGLP